ncbi:MAG: hypothetical protein U0872_06020 [Planctomycetaceae bacterium]
MSAPERPGVPRSDDDSWGKLASDLFGIKLDEEEDLDISDLVPPVVAPAAPPAPPPTPVVSDAVHEIDLADMDFEADDDEDEDVDEPAPPVRHETPNGAACCFRIRRRGGRAGRGWGRSRGGDWCRRSRRFLGRAGELGLGAR